MEDSMETGVSWTTFSTGAGAGAGVGAGAGAGVSFFAAFFTGLEALVEVLDFLAADF
jgi:hypothetical protein